MESINVDFPKITVERSIFEHSKLEEKLDEKKYFIYNHCCSFKSFIYQLIPSIYWLKHYQWKRDVTSDLISGFTVTALHIPQGMACGLLGNTPPVFGIYTNFFPVLIYILLGTSKHLSMGTFAILFLMTGKAVLEHSHPSFFSEDFSLNETSFNQTLDAFYSPSEVAAAVTFTVGLFQVVLYLLRLGFLSVLLSEPLVSGFITGAAFQLISSQIKDLLGLKMRKIKGYFAVIKTVVSAFEEISTINWAAVVISSITILSCSLNNELLKPLVSKKSVFPVPMELIVIVVGTLVSHYFNLTQVYAVDTIGRIPSGLPEPQLPPLNLLSSVLIDGLTIAIVAYSVSLSLALMFAQKLHYDVDSNQELLALGAGNIFGSFFSSIAFTASLSRSSVQQTVGGKSQIASLVACVLLLVVLLWIGPFFEPLPKSVLASVIIVALKEMILEIRAIRKFWKYSKIDAFIWLATFGTVLIVSVEIGLVVGVMLSLITLLILNVKSQSCLLGVIPHTNIYVNSRTYKKAVELDGIKIFQYCGGINFANKNMFKTELLRYVNLNIQKEILYRNKLEKYATKPGYQKQIRKIEEKINRSIKCIILDFSTVNHVDLSGASMLQTLIEVLQGLKICIIITGCTEPIKNVFFKIGLLNKNEIKYLGTVHDGVEYCSTVS